MPTSIKNGAVEDFVVEPRALMGLEVLTPKERRIVEAVTRNKKRFLALASDPKNVERLRPTAPYYSLKITPELRLIFTREGDRIVVEDLRTQGFLDWWASLPSGRAEPATEKPNPSSRGKRNGPHEGAE
jgi:hypothetical protein